MRNRSRGFTLVELLLVLSVGGLLTTLAICGLERAMTFDSATRSKLDQARGLNQLCDQFRYDVHLATEPIVASADGAMVVLSGSLVKYSIELDRIDRTEVMSDGSTRYEAYRLGENLVFEFATTNKPELAILSVRFNTGLRHAPSRFERMIVAAIGQRLSKATQTGDTP